MSLASKNHILRVLVAAFAGALLFLGVALVAVLQMSTVYSSTTTVGLTLTDEQAGVENLGQVPIASPLFTEAARSPQTRAAAKTLADSSLGEISVSTFRETPIVFNLTGSGETAEQAQGTADAYARALAERSEEIFPGGAITANVISEATLPASADRPRPALTLLAAGAIGAAIGAAIGWWWRQARARAQGAQQHKKKEEVAR